MEISLTRVGDTGIFALPDGKTADNIQSVLLDGEPVEYVPVKDGTEIDVPEARTGMVVTAILKEEGEI
jgi:hypothetical protein